MGGRFTLLVGGFLSLFYTMNLELQTSVLLFDGGNPSEIFIFYNQHHHFEHAFLCKIF